MFYFQPTIILRHRKENLKKCTLHGLETRTDFHFFSYPQQPLPCINNYFLLSLDGIELCSQDAEFGIFLIDGTWRYATLMEKTVPATIQRRSLPAAWKTAYPRYQTGCLDADRGLASIEALYVAYKIIGRDTSELLNHYFWKNDFLQKNRHLC